METYLPIFKAILSDWILITLANPLYASVLGFLVFLITAMLYSIRIASLKQKNVISEKAHLEMEGMLNAELTSAKQKVEAMQDELFINTEQMKKDQLIAQNEVERAVKFEGQISTRNKQIAMVIQTLATSFDLGERPLPLMGDVEAEDLWQQHDRVIKLLITRLRNEQQAKIQLQESYQDEMARRLEKETLIETLQVNLATQSSQLMELENAIEEQKTMLLQQQDTAQQALERHMSESARLVELERQAFDLVGTKQQLTQLEEKLSNKDALIIQVEKDKLVEQAKVGLQSTNVKQEIKEKSVDLKLEIVTPAKDKYLGVSGKFKNFFGKASKETAVKEAKGIEVKEEVMEVQPITADIQQPSEATAGEKMGGMTGKFKSLLGKAKQKPIEINSEVDEIKEPIIETDLPIAEIDLTSLSSHKNQEVGVTGRFKNPFRKTKQEPIEKEVDIVEVKEEIVTDTEQVSVSPVKQQGVGLTGKFKNLFGKAK